MKKETNILLIVGGILLIGYAWTKSVKINEKKGEVLEESSLPEKFINDVKNMSKDDIQKAIKDNEKYLENKGISEDSRKAIESMLEYLRSKG